MKRQSERLANDMKSARALGFATSRHLHHVLGRDRHLALLEKTGLVDHQDCIRISQFSRA